MLRSNLSSNQWKTRWGVWACSTLLIAISTLAGCANLTEGGGYTYSFDNYYNLAISKDYKYLGKIQAPSDSITVAGGISHPINLCSGYVVIEAYYIENGDNIDEIATIYQDHTANRCTWYDAHRKLADRFLKLCSDENNKYVMKLNELAESKGKKITGCYHGLMKYGYTGRKTHYEAYLFLSEDQISRSGKTPEDALQDRMKAAVQLVQ